MWMLAIFFPYIALIVLKRYVEATIIAIVWVLAIPIVLLDAVITPIFPPAAFLFIPILAILPITSILAGLYTSQSPIVG